MTFNQVTDIQVLHDKGKLIPADWATRLPNNSSPYYSLPAFLVRAGNPKGIKDWDDLVKPGVQVIFPNPKTSGNAHYTYLAAYAFAKYEIRLRRQSRRVRAASCSPTCRCSIPADALRRRRSSNAQTGDVLITFETETNNMRDIAGADKYQVVVPSQSLLAEFPVTIVDKYADKHGTSALAKAYLEFLYTPESQTILAKQYNRVNDQAVMAQFKDQVSGSEARDHRRGIRWLGQGEQRPSQLRRQARPIVWRQGRIDLLKASTMRRSPSPLWGEVMNFEISEYWRCAVRSFPGFGLSFGMTLAYLGVIVLLPLGALLVKASGISGAQLVAIVTSPRTLSALRVTISTALLATAFNAVYGLLLAWVLARYEFPGKRVLDALVDVPFALPTAVAGLALTALFAKNGWFGAPLAQIGISVAYTPLGIAIAMAFTSLPFVVRTVQPVIEDLGSDAEEAGRSLGANDFQILRTIIFPGDLSGVSRRMLAGFRAQPRRVRRGDLHRRQPADEDRDHGAADVHSSRGIQLHWRCCDRDHHAAVVVRHVARDQPRPGLASALSRSRGLIA